MIFWSMSAADAEEFYKRCVDREAVTIEERMAIMEELMEERKDIQMGEFDDEDGQVQRLLEENDGVIGFKKPESQRIDDSNLN